MKKDEFLTDLVISKFSNLFGGLDTIKYPKQMEDELLSYITCFSCTPTPAKKSNLVSM